MTNSSPWVLHRKGALMWIDAGSLCVAEIPANEDGGAQIAKANLIVAAPDLLAALEELCTIRDILCMNPYYPPTVNRVTTAWEQVRAAIAKAEGK